MTRSILKTVFIGILIGVTAFFVPKMLLGVFTFFAVMCLFHSCAHRRHHGRLLYMADKVRLMSEEEYAEFKTNMGSGCRNSNHHHHSHCGCKSKSKCNAKSKKEETTK